MNRKSVLAWCFYDWANSVFPTLITTFVFATYFTKGIAETPEQGTAQWAWAMGLAGVLVALLGPILGAISDRAGRRKPWLAVLTGAVGLSMIGLWFATPDPSSVQLALTLVVISAVAFELSMVFYNAMLPEIAPESMIGRISGWGWGLGYTGGLAALIVCLIFFIQPDPALFGLDKESSEHVRAISVLGGVWVLVFALPMFIFVPDRPDTGISTWRAITGGLRTLLDTIMHVRRYKDVVRFLIARMFYIDGLNTLFAFGGIFAAGAFGMNTEEVLLFAISLNVASGIGAAGFAFLDDKWGPKPVIALSVAAISVLGIAMLLVDDKAVFWGLGIGLGLFLGPAQAASRSMMAHLSPRELATEFFGLYAFSGRATAFLGPWFLALAVDATGSQHWGMATVFPFLIVGLILLRGVRAS